MADEKFECIPYEPKYKIIYLPNATYWPDNSLQFNNRKAAQGYLDWIFPIIEKNNYKHLYEVVEV